MLDIAPRAASIARRPSKPDYERKACDRTGPVGDSGKQINPSRLERTALQPGVIRKRN